MKIFNTNRKIAIKTHRLNNYLLYAIGEIVLVVIGIVIGLQVNKWNDLNSKQTKINNYYSSINEEVTSAIELIEYNTKYSDSLVKGLTNCLQSMALKKSDSSFINNLSFLSDNEQQTFFFPTIDEFLALGYLSSVEDLSLRKQFQVLEYYRKQSNVEDSNIQLFSENLLKPKLVDKLNFLEIDYNNTNNSHFGFKKLVLNNNFKNDYNKLINDLTMWNLIIYRIDLEKNRIVVNKSLSNVLSRIQEKTSANNMQ